MVKFGLIGFRMGKAEKEHFSVTIGHSKSIPLNSKGQICLVTLVKSHYLSTFCEKLLVLVALLNTILALFFFFFFFFVNKRSVSS